MRETEEAKFSEIYDSEDDVYYVSFETGEPSYVEEVDDILLIELGIFTNMPTGFRILNFKKLRTKLEIIRKVQKTLDAARREYPATFRQRESQVTSVLQRALA